MPKYKVDIGGKKYLIEADSPESLPDIVDDISKRASPGQEKSGLTKALSSSEKPQKTGDPLIDFMLFTQKEVVGPLAQGANTAAFGLPKVIANKINPEFSKQMFPEQSAMGGKILRGTADLAGLVGGGAAKLGQSVSQRLIPQVVSNIGLKDILAKRAAVGAIDTFRRLKLVRDVGRSALSGAIFGASQIFGDETSLSRQTSQAIGSSLFGAATPIVGAGLKGLVKGYKKFVSVPKRGALTRLSEATKSAKLVSRMKIDELRKSADREIRDTVKAINNNTIALQDELFNVAKKGAGDIQVTLKEFSRATSDAYGNHLDDITGSMIAKGKKITKGELNSFFDRVANRLDEVGALSPEARNLIDEAKDNLGVRIIGKSSKFISARTGERVGGALKSNSDDVVPFRTLVDHVKRINGLFSGQLKRTGQLNQGDIGVSVLRQEYGNLLGSEYAKLNSEYAKAATALKRAYVIFKPGQKEFGVSSGVNTLRRLGTGKIGEGERNVIEFLEQGTEIGGKKIKGIGPVSNNLKNIGEKINASKNISREVKKKISTVRDERILAVKSVLEKRLMRLDNRKQIVQDILAGKTLKEDSLKKLRAAGGAALTVAGILALLRELKGGR